MQNQNLPKIVPNGTLPSASKAHRSSALTQQFVSTRQVSQVTQILLRPLFTLALLSLSIQAAAEQSTPTEKPTSWVGAPLGVLRFEGSYDDTKDSTLGKINRAYLGYKAKWGQDLEAAAVYDAVPETSPKGEAAGHGSRLQNAYLKFLKLAPGTELTLGIQNTPGYLLVGDIWDMQYLRPNIVTTLASNPNADLGAVLQNSHSMGEGQLKVVTGALQGSGYRKQSTSLEEERWLFGTSWKQSKGLTASIYSEWRPWRNTQNKDGEILLSGHTGWIGDWGRAGIEGLWQYNAMGSHADKAQVKAVAGNLFVKILPALEVFTHNEWTSTDMASSANTYSALGLQAIAAPKTRLSTAYVFKWDEAKDQNTQLVGVWAEVVF